MADSVINCSRSYGRRILPETVTHQPGVDAGVELLESPERSMVSLCSRPWPLPCRCLPWDVLSAVESSAQAPLKSAQPIRTRTSFPLLKRFDRQPCGILLIESSDGTNRKSPRRRERKTHSYIIKLSSVNDDRSLPNPGLSEINDRGQPRMVTTSFSARGLTGRATKFLCVTKLPWPLSNRERMDTFWNFCCALLMWAPWLRRGWRRDRPAHHSRPAGSSETKERA
jgi:hypothetical protein